MSFHAKAGRLAALRPDLAVVPECACPEVLLRRAPELEFASYAWAGASSRKGLAVFSIGDWRLATDRAADSRSATALPVRVTGPASFRLLAVWALPRRSRRASGASPEPLARAIARLAPFLDDRPAIVAGDFNSALVSRRPGGSVRPSRLVGRLADLGFVSAYHRARRVEHGAEREATLFLNRRLARGRHTDHVFVDQEIAAGLRSVTVGRGERWVALSDHAPVIVDVDVPSSRRI